MILADYTTTIEFNATETVTDVTNKIKSSLNDLNSVLNSFSRGISLVNGATRRYNSMMSGFNNTIKEVVSDVGSAIYDFTSDSISNFNELEQQHARTLGAMANNYDSTLDAQQRFFQASKELKEQAIELGTYGPTGQGSFYSPTNISEIQTELIKSGKTADQILNTDAIDSIIKFAAGNDLETGTAVDFAVTLGSQFGYEMENWDEMLDMVSHAADLSVVDVEDIVQSMKYAGGITGGLDRDMSETLGTIAYLGNFGLKGSMAGTGVQALLTRLLTADTQVMTEAQKEVAPPKALEAFYAFEKSAKPDGNLLDMSEVVGLLDETMAGLNDEEQAWFSKKLVGLYQMKAMYALTNDNGEDAMTLDEMQEDIENDSADTNLNKYGLLLDSDYGLQVSLTNAWEGVKTDFGSRISEFTGKIREEIYNVITSDGSYRIDFDSIRDALELAVDQIEERFGESVADSVRNIGTFAIDMSQIFESVAPEFATGLLNVLNEVINFNVPGTMSEWGNMIDNMRNSVGDLPDDMKKLGDTVVSVIDWMGKLVAINIASQGLQMSSDLILTITNIGKAVSLISTALAGVPALVTAVTGIAAILGVAFGTNALGDSTATKWDQEQLRNTVWSKDNPEIHDVADKLITSDMQNSWDTFAKSKSISDDGSLSMLLRSEMTRYVYQQSQEGRTVSSAEYNSVLKDTYSKYSDLINGESGYYTNNGNVLLDRGNLNGSDYTEYIYGKDKDGNIDTSNKTTLMTALSEYINDYEYGGADEVNMNATTVNITDNSAKSKDDIGSYPTSKDMGLSNVFKSEDSGYYTSKNLNKNKVNYSDKPVNQQLSGAFATNASEYGYSFDAIDDGGGVATAVQSFVAGVNNLDTIVGQLIKDNSPTMNGVGPVKSNFGDGIKLPEGGLKSIIDNQLQIDNDIKISPQQISLQPSFSINAKIDGQTGKVVSFTTSPSLWKDYINYNDHQSSRYAKSVSEK